MASKAKPLKKPRVRATPRYRSFRLSKKKYKQAKPIPSAWFLLKATFGVLKRNKKLFLGIALLNAIISFIFVQGLGSSFELQEVKNELDDLFGNSSTERVGTAAALFGYLLGTAGTTADEVSSAYQLFLTLITSLAVIWTVRQLQAGEKPKIRDGFYKGVYPLIPFILVLFVIGLQLVPLVIGNLVFSTVVQNALAITILEKALWLLLFIGLALLSGYMLTSSIFSLYIVTLPEMTPFKALRSARELVLHRRLSVGLRLFALPLMLLVLSIIVFIPLLLFAAPVVQALFLVGTSFGLIIVHIYLYLLYRALL